MSFKRGRSNKHRPGIPKKRKKNARWVDKARRRSPSSKPSRQSISVLRRELLDAYGNCCECCGETEEQFLTLEHKLGDGKEHRARCGSNMAVLLDVKRQGYPRDRYGLLCANCNYAESKGGCPHKDPTSPSYRPPGSSPALTNQPPAWTPQPARSRSTFTTSLAHDAAGKPSTP